MALNTLVTPTWVTNDTAMAFINSVKGIPNFNRTYDDQFKQAGAKVGAVVNARLPVRFVTTSGQAYNEQAITETTTPVSLSEQKQVAFGWSSVQGTLEVDKVQTRYTKPAGYSLSNAADLFAMERVYRLVNQFVGTIGTTPNSVQTWTDAGVKLYDGAVEGPEGRVAVVDTLAMSRLSVATQTLFNPSSEISANYRRGMVGNMQLGIEYWYQDQNVPRHTTGTFTSSTPLVNTAGQTGSSITSTGWASGATSLKRGDIISFAGVFSVNPVSYNSTGRLAQFTLTADISDTTGAITLPIYPSLVPCSPGTGTSNTNSIANVTASPALNAGVIFWGSSGTYAFTATVSPQSLVITPDFAAFVMADMVEPKGGADCHFARSMDKNVSIRFVEQWSALADKQLNRMDILIGADILQERFAVRVVG